jgi:hypothetical protein
MPFDKYSNWPFPFHRPSYPPPPEIRRPITIEEQVISDLEMTKDVVDKLEILDSYAAYSKRSYRAELAEQLSISVGQQLERILRPTIETWLPEIRPPSRPRMSKVDETE